MSKRNTRTRDFLGKDVFVHNLDIFIEPIENAFTSDLSKIGSTFSGIDPDYDVFFNHNSLGYRSDEFKANHNGRHILFSGCSVTYGIGLDEEELWSKKLFNKIAKEEKVSGYFNLGSSGMGVMEIVSTIYKYIGKFGKPDCIFLNIPDTHRIYLYDVQQNNYFYTQFDFQGDRKIYEDSGSPRFIMSKSFTIIAYHYLMMLEAYCKANDIFLSYVTWSSNPELVSTSDLSNLYRYTDLELEKYVSEYVDQNPTDSNIATARDKKHLGTGPHYAWSEMLYNVYREEAGLKI